MTMDTLPRIEDAKRTDKRRGVMFEWEVGTIAAEGPSREKRVLAVLTITHHKAGMNYFSGERTMEDHFDVVLRNETEEKGDIFTSRGFMVGSGIRVGRIDAGNRYSAKKLREAEAEGVVMFDRFVAAGDGRVLRYFADGGAE